MGERTIPILPCRDLDEIVGFYAALGFVVTFRQTRPNPYLCLQRGGLDLHFFAVEGLDPESSMGSAIVLVPDSGALFDEFAAGLRDAFGALPLAGIPRITRPRRKQGTAGGFTVVDPGGNWLRISSSARDAETVSDEDGHLDKVLLTAARQGDARGDITAAITVIKAGLVRHIDAAGIDRVPVLAYLAELYVRSGDEGSALATLDALDEIELDPDDEARVAGARRDAAELRSGIAGGTSR